MPTPALRVPPPPPRRARGRAGASHLALSPGRCEPGAPRCYLDLRAGPDATSTPGRSATVFQHSSRRSRLRHRSCSARASQSVMMSENGSGRGARRPWVGGGVRSGAAGRLQRAPPGQAALPAAGGGAAASERVTESGPGGGSPRAALANRVAGFRARSLARRHAHTRGRVGGGSGASGAPDPRARRVVWEGRGARRDAWRLRKRCAGRGGCSRKCGYCLSPPGNRGN